MSSETAAKYRSWCSACMDFHAHFLHPQVFERSTPHSPSTCFGKSPQDPNSPNFRRMFEPERQVADMEAWGIDSTIISSADVVASRSWAQPGEEAYLAALTNDMASDWAARFPSRFVPTAVLPLGDIQLALRELERCMACGIRILNLPSNYRDIYLGHQRYSELWAAIHAHELVVFIHPDGVRDPWYQDYAMWNSIGQSIEEVRVMSSLIYEGVLERHRGLKIVMAHGGGYMPHYMGRLDRNASFRPWTTRNLSKKPSEYLRDFYYDSCVYDIRTLEFLVERVGADRIVLGSDYPFGGFDPLDFLETATQLSDEQRAAIAGGTARELLRGLLD
jgi:aminocarboxymuconate-semialdehyde decarboxylase